MTKRRPALSFHQAIDRIAGRIGYAAMADVTGRAERTVRNWSDPDTGALPNIEDAFRLDEAFLRSGGGEAPMMSVMGLRLELSCRPPADVEALIEATTRAVKEAGEAFAALIEAGHNHTSPAAVELARRETEEAIEALKATLRQLPANSNRPYALHEHRATGPPP